MTKNDFINQNDQHSDEIDESSFVSTKNVSGKDWFGMDEGKGWTADDFNDLPEDFLDEFFNEDDKLTTK